MRKRHIGRTSVLSYEAVFASDDVLQPSGRVQAARGGHYLVVSRVGRGESTTPMR